MATQFNFNGQLIKLPGVYTQTKSGVNNPPLDLSFGNVLYIDIDPNSEFGGGAGINGELSDTKDSIYTFDSLISLRSFIRGGELWDIAAPLFKPFGAGVNGVSQLRYIRALTTTAASSTITFTGSGLGGGTFTVKAKHEGLPGNGDLIGDTQATNSIEITSTGADTDTITITADETAFGGSALDLYIYTSNGTDTTGEAAIEIANGINNSGTGYTASVVGPTITISVPADRDTNSNDVDLTSTVTGTATVSIVSTDFTGWVQGTILSKGLGFIMETSPSDPTKFILKFYRGSYTGLASDSIPYDGISALSSIPELIATSTSFNTYEELLDWFNTDFDFNNNLELTSSTKTGDGSVDAVDAANYALMTVLSGGTQTYAPADLTAVLDNISDLDYTFVIAPDGGSNYASTVNEAILSHLVSSARFEKFMLVAGGRGRNEFVSQTIAATNHFDTDRVIVVHGACQVASAETATGLREKSSKYKLAAVLGRMCGLEPQTPITFKGISIAGEIHKLNKAEKERGLDEGVLMTAFDSDINAFTIVQGVNSLQRNRNVVNSDGTSHSIQLKRIAAQLNKEIEVNAKTQLLGNQSVGPNRNTLSPEVVAEWLKGYLGRKTATSTTDNLILSFQDISVSIVQDAYQINYAFVPNFEVNKLFFTGLIIDPNL